MQEQLLPDRQVGMVAPLLVSCEVAYQFYRLQADMGEHAWRVSLSQASMDLRAFSSEALDQAETALDRLAVGLIRKGADVLLLGGVPVVAIKGLEYWRGRLETLSQAHGCPFVSDLECSLIALNRLGARRIVIANKWDRALNNQLQADVEQYSGIKVVGVGALTHSADEISGLKALDGAATCREVCRRALAAATETPDALFLAGGAWYSTLLIADLEKEFGIPVVTNPGAAMWHALNTLDRFAPTDGWGTLYTLEAFGAEGAPVSVNRNEASES